MVVHKSVVRRKKGLPGNAKQLYSFLFDEYRESGQTKFKMSRKELAAELGISPGTAAKNMHRLERMGYIKIIPAYNSDGGRSANKYMLRG